MIENTSPEEGATTAPETAAEKPAPAKKTAAKKTAKPKPEAKAEPKPEPKAEPTVEVAPEFEAGQKVRHANGKSYDVLQVLPEGVKLAGVANLVHPSALEPLKQG